MLPWPRSTSWKLHDVIFASLQCSVLWFCDSGAEITNELWNCSFTGALKLTSAFGWDCNLELQEHMFVKLSSAFGWDCNLELQEHMSGVSLQLPRTKQFFLRLIWRDFSGWLQGINEQKSQFWVKSLMFLWGSSEPSPVMEGEQRALVLNSTFIEHVCTENSKEMRLVCMNWKVYSLDILNPFRSLNLLLIFSCKSSKVSEIHPKVSQNLR